jgi:hypothetical protein
MSIPDIVSGLPASVPAMTAARKAPGGRRGLQGNRRSAVDAVIADPTVRPPIPEGHFAAAGERDSLTGLPLAGALGSLIRELERKGLLFHFHGSLN